MSRDSTEGGKEPCRYLHKRIADRWNRLCMSKRSVFPVFEKQEEARMGGGDLETRQRCEGCDLSTYRKIAEGKIIKGLVGHCKDCNF